MAVNQLRTRLIARNAFSWRDHFYLQGDDDILPHLLWGYLKKKKSMTTKIVVFSVMFWANGGSARWSSVAKFLA